MSQDQPDQGGRRGEGSEAVPTGGAHGSRRRQRSTSRDAGDTADGSSGGPKAPSARDDSSVSYQAARVARAGSGARGRRPSPVRRRTRRGSPASARRPGRHPLPQAGAGPAFLGRLLPVEIGRAAGSQQERSPPGPEPRRAGAGGPSRRRSEDPSDGPGPVVSGGRAARSRRLRPRDRTGYGALAPPAPGPANRRDEPGEARDERSGSWRSRLAAGSARTARVPLLGRHRVDRPGLRRRGRLHRSAGRRTDRGDHPRRRAARPSPRPSWVRPWPGPRPARRPRAVRT